MPTVSFTTATEHLDPRMLRDIGVETDGAPIDQGDPHYRRVVRPANAIGRWLDALILSAVVLLRA